MSELLNDLYNKTAVELKEILHTKGLSGNNITDKNILISMIVCDGVTSTTNNEKLPISYTSIFEEEDRLIKNKLEQIEDYLNEKRMAKIQQDIEKLNSIKLLQKRTEDRSSYSSFTNAPSLRQNTSLFVEGLPIYIDENDLYNFFSTVGSIKRTKIIILYYYDNSGKSKGEGLIIFEAIKTMEKALKLYSNKDIRPHYPLKLSIAQFKSAPLSISTTEIPAVNADEDPYVCVLSNIIYKPDLSYDSYIESIENDIKSFSNQFGDIIAVTHDENAHILIRFESSDSTSRCIDYWKKQKYNGKNVYAETFVEHLHSKSSIGVSTSFNNNNNNNNNNKINNNNNNNTATTSLNMSFSSNFSSSLPQYNNSIQYMPSSSPPLSTSYPYYYQHINQNNYSTSSTNQNNYSTPSTNQNNYSNLSTNQNNYSTPSTNQTSAKSPPLVSICSASPTVVQPKARAMETHKQEEQQKKLLNSFFDEISKL
ncbi:hypothetical protein WA158_008016 [Blastocystis sp. Blastoise]